MKNDQAGCWIDEVTKKEIVSLLREAKDMIRKRPDNGGISGNIGRIEKALSKLGTR